VAAFDLAARVPRIHALVHNAGLMPPERQVSVQGHELAFATHVLGPFELTMRLAPILDRVIFMSSGGMSAQKLDVQDPEFLRGEYSGSTAYARTKRAQVVLAELLAGDLAQRGVVVHSMHPGWADTPGVATSLPRFRKLTGPILRDAEQGADTAVWLCAADEPGRGTGLFWHDRRPRPTHYLPFTRESEQDRAALWGLCRSGTAEYERGPR
jgi:NAD(P)-dependent dehydrogenase (short-subunit alcohol dehydrogenase family)